MTNILLAFIIFLSSLPAMAQQTPDELLQVFRTDYGPTIAKRHELFLLEYNKARLQDYLALYKHNTTKVNALSSRLEAITNSWRPMVKVSMDQSADLPLLASMKQESLNIKRELDEAAAVLSSVASSIEKSCHEETISWMNERFLPTRIYRIPHYQFTGDGASNNLNLTFQMNYSTSFGQDSYRPGSESNGQVSGQMGDGSKEATACAAAGMVIGVTVGSIFPVIGTTVGGYVGTAVGATVGSIISSAKQMKEANREYEKLKRTYHAINETIESAHDKIDGLHVALVTSVCQKVFDPKIIANFQETDFRAQSVQDLVTSEVAAMETEWAQVKNFHLERLRSHEMFLTLVLEGYGTNFESRLQDIDETMITLNNKMKSFYSLSVAPALAAFDPGDLYEVDRLIGLHIQGEAEFNHPEFPNYTWQAISQKMKTQVGIP